MGRRKVHDEQLRVRLLDTAGNLLESEGVEALSMRRLAAAAGTSTTAVYSLFGGKPGLLRALLAEAFTRLGVHLDAVAPSDDPLADIQALRRAYRAFATSDPHRYNIMASSLLGWAGEMSTCFFLLWSMQCAVPSPRECCPIPIRSLLPPPYGLLCTAWCHLNLSMRSCRRPVHRLRCSKPRFTPTSTAGE